MNKYPKNLRKINKYTTLCPFIFWHVDPGISHWDWVLSDPSVWYWDRYQLFWVSKSLHMYESNGHTHLWHHWKTRAQLAGVADRNIVASRKCGVLLIIFNYWCVGVIIHDCVWLYKETFCWFCEPFAVFSLFLNLICAYGERSRVGWLYFIEKRYSDWELDRGGCMPGTAAT